MNTYLGQKGYTIPKNELTIQKQVKIREDLTIKPFTVGSSLNNVKSFPCYRESSNKFYVPHYYGVQYFGAPKQYKINEGSDINLKFNGKLRENQEIVVNTYLEHVKTVGFGGGLLELPCAYGKCLGKDTEILMYDGSIKKVQHVVVGDILMGDDSTPRKVLTLAKGREQMYKISSKKGDAYVCNESHILSLKSSVNNGKIKKGDVVDISVFDYLNLPKKFHGNNGGLLGYKTQIEFKPNKILIDPYLLGYWLGNNSYEPTEINIKESSVIKYIADLFKDKYNDLYLEYTRFKHKYIINSIKNKSIFFDFLLENKLLNDKHIPHKYLCNSKDNRLALLAGLIDSRGYLNKNYFAIIHKNEKLLDGIVYLARSLGFASYKKVLNTDKQQESKGIYFYVNIYGKGISEIPTLSVSKKPYEKTELKDPLTYKLQIEKLDVDDYYGFEIDGNRRFVLADFTVTHNTVLSLNIITHLNKKTFIIVHKEFLMNQWIERIHQFLPNAKVGKIQGPIVDVNDKDIVIGMLQSLSMKEYPLTIFQDFGLTIIDEVHHISSEVFSNSLFKIVTKYMLGLSATMNRKDGTTSVFKMFLGDIIFKGNRDEERDVTVRAIEYYADDDEFNEVKLDYKGNVQYSSMISKLCEFNRRSEFILKVLSDMLNENFQQQIMILAHNKNLLKYLHDAIKHRNIATVGYYVGGMKEIALKETETKKVVIATYAMAAEALDIKTLTTLIMATPKTDIQQSVGRILRDKHSNPIVVDIVDNHDLFKNQWRKRKIFYKKENYKIIYIKNTDYSTDLSKWIVVNNPNSKGVSENKLNKPRKKKPITIRTNSSSEKSIISDSETENDNCESQNSFSKKSKICDDICFLKVK